MNITRNMDVAVHTSGETKDQDSVQTALKDKLSTIYLGDVIGIWQDHRQVCAGTHADFAKHLLAMHKEYCLDYCRAESQEKAAVLSLCVDSQCTHQTNDCKLFESMKKKYSNEDDSHQSSGSDQPLAKDEPEDLQNEKESDDDTIEDSFWEEDESDHDALQEDGWELTMDTPQEADSGNCRCVIPCVRTDCGGTFSEMKYLESHIQTHKADNNDVSSDSLNDHSTRQLTEPMGETSHVCTICHIIFKNLSRFEAHIKNHSGDKLNVFLNRNKGSSEACNSINTMTDKQENNELVNQLESMNVQTKKPMIAIPPIDTQESAAIKVEVQDSIDDVDVQKNCSVVQPEIKTETRKKLDICLDCGKEVTHTGEKQSVDPGDNVVSSQIENRDTHTGVYPIAMSSVHSRHTAAIKDVVMEGIQETKSAEKSPAIISNQGKETKSSVDQPLKTQITKGKLHVCPDCGNEFNHVSTLMRHMQTHTGKRPYVCSDCGNGFNHVSSLKVHMMIHTGEKPHVCSDCGSRFNKISHLKSHRRTHTGEKPYSCSECGRAFSQSSHLKGHMNTHKTKKAHICTDCGQGFNDLSNLNRHKRSHAGEMPHKCLVCNKTYSSSASLKVHMKTHKGDSFLECRECGNHFKHVSSLKIHMRSHTGERPHVCSECGRAYTVLSRLKAHQLTHTGEKPHLCSLCGKGFRQSNLLKFHMSSRHTGEKPHVCTDCGKGFIQLGDLKKHMMTHTGDKPHVCDMCGKRFSVLRDLKQHIMTHTGEKPHVCQECGKGFIIERALKIHIRIHTGEKPHLCTQCGKGFRRLDHLKVHMISHTGDLSHVCSDCGKGFSTKQGLTRHMRIHTGEKRYVCVECGKAFHQGCNLKTHMKVHRR